MLYLERLAATSPEGGFPEVWPVATFEGAWVLYLPHRAEALAHRPDRYPGQLAKIREYLLTERRGGGWWQDKWDASAYYATAQVIFALAGAGDDPPYAGLAGTRRWLLKTQHPDGSWGEPVPRRGDRIRSFR